MGAIKDNTGKWIGYVSGRLYSDNPSAQDLNTDLQKNVADEFDSVINAFIGTAVVGSTSWVVSPTSNPLEVKVGPGAGVFEGQQGASASDTVLPTLPASTSDILVYAELDDTEPDFDNTLHSWVPKFNFTTGSAPARSITLAVITTPSSGVIPAGNVLDTRQYAETLTASMVSVNDSATPAETAVSFRNRIDMLATRVKSILGGSDWKDAIPISLATLNGKFSTTTGHKHDGTAGGGVKITAVDISYTPPAGISATNVSAALTEIHAKNLSIDGSQDMTGLFKLAGDPTHDLHAATRRYVDQRILMRQAATSFIKSFTALTGTQISLTTQSNTPTASNPIAINARGIPIEFSTDVKISYGYTAQVVNPTLSALWAPAWQIRWRLYRDGALLLESSSEFPKVLSFSPDSVNSGVVFNEFFLFDIPKFIDPTPGGTITTPQGRTYDLQAIWVRNTGGTIISNMSLLTEVGPWTPYTAGRSGTALGSVAHSGPWYAREI